MYASDTWRCYSMAHTAPTGPLHERKLNQERRRSSRRRTAPKCISGSTVSLVAHKLPWHRGTPTGHFPGRLVNHAIQGRILLVQKSFPAKMLTIMPWHRPMTASLTLRPLADAGGGGLFYSRFPPFLGDAALSLPHVLCCYSAAMPGLTHVTRLLGSATTLRTSTAVSRLSASSASSRCGEGSTRLPSPVSARSRQRCSSPSPLSKIIQSPRLG